MIKNNYIKKTVYSLIFLLTISSCTDSYDDMNTNPNGVSDDMVDAGSFFSQMQQSIYNNFENTHSTFQVQQNLNSDLYSGYMSVPTNFSGGQNNSNYALIPGWNNTPYNVAYKQVMKNHKEIQKRAEFDKTDFYAVAQILKVAAMSRLTDLHGPLPYFEYGNATATVPYDSQEDIYMSFFEDLKAAADTLTAFLVRTPNETPFTQYDMLYNGNYVNWVKFANSLRLRLAMRIVKVKPEMARLEAEAACAQKYGVFIGNDEMATVKNMGKVTTPLAVLSEEYNDIRVGAPVESILVGLQDPRIERYMFPCGEIKKNDVVVVKDVYKGIRNGIEIIAKGDYTPFSKLGSPWTLANMENTPLPLMYTAEVYFLRAEGRLRGWNVGTETPQEFYEQGVKLSFSQWNVSGVDVYLADDTSKPIDYVDPVNPVNDISAASDITVKWDDADDQERKLERIITQKWISMFPEGAEAWTEYRRTGYPKLFPVVVNYSKGEISTEEGIRRLPFPKIDYDNNSPEMERAVNLLNGPDTGGTRLWWDVKKSNF